MEARSTRRGGRRGRAAVGPHGVGGGIFITLEGPDGAGKSSQADRLAARLRAEGHVVMQVREPGGTPLAEAVRALVNGPADHDPWSSALLFNAARAQLVRRVIGPALARGEVVVGDRHTDSTLAYQGYGSGLDLDELRRLDQFAVGDVGPDLTILLDLPVDVGLARRAEGAASGHTRWEDPTQHDHRFHERVRHGYLALAAAEPERWRVVDADRAPDVIGAEVGDLVVAWLAGRGSAAARGEPAAAAVRITR
ncbi:MAG TPA: dTMP kinase [Candidatus Sulfotelmatobacter sp.]|nr:dTMP kinase [Candidatus Sulfotelmatobacter sp.]